LKIRRWYDDIHDDTWLVNNIYEVVNIKKIKKIAKHQQYRVVTKAVEKLESDKKENKVSDKCGVIWHTQGSGKSLSMLWLVVY
jgi:type I restriction enzyme, R subunit